jgi:hypothetical protein
MSKKSSPAAWAVVLGALAVVLVLGADGYATLF